MSEPYSAKFQITTGHWIQVHVGFFWPEGTEPKDFLRLAYPKKYHAIRVYTTEDTLPLRLELRHEYRDGVDYRPEAVPAVERWIDDILADRRHGDYDNVEIFLDDLAEALDKLTNESDDLVSHLAEHDIETDPAILGFEADDAPKEDEPELPMDR